MRQGAELLPDPAPVCESAPGSPPKRTSEQSDRADGTNLYAWPRVGRAGLGNSLFPWARAELFAQRSGTSILAPRWTSLRLGPYLRGEPDKRGYAGFFHAPHHLRGMTRARLAIRGRRIEEAHISTAARELTASARPCIIEFKGLGGMFTPLTGEHELIHERLWDMTVPRLRPAQHASFIAMHVRRGDLTRQGLSPMRLDREVTQFTPLAWFIAMAQAVRRVATLRSLPIIVFTDGSLDELGRLIEIDGVRLAPRSPAITDLWALTRASLLFASGFSTFSMWASYLGGMPTIYAPGKIQQRVQAGHPRSIEIELAAGADIPTRVCGAIVS